MDRKRDRDRERDRDRYALLTEMFSTSGFPGFTKSIEDDITERIFLEGERKRLIEEQRRREEERARRELEEIRRAREEELARTTRSATGFDSGIIGPSKSSFGEVSDKSGGPGLISRIASTLASYVPRADENGPIIEVYSFHNNNLVHKEKNRIGLIVTDPVSLYDEITYNKIDASGCRSQKSIEHARTCDIIKSNPRRVKATDKDAFKAKKTSSKHTGGAYKISAIWSTYFDYGVKENARQFTTLSPKEISNLEKLYSKLARKNIRRMKENLIESQPNKEIISEFTEVHLEENGYVEKIKIDPKCKVVLFGDHHGSFHTFMRNMIRLHIYNVVDLLEFRVKDGYMLVFTGDIVDRGNFGMDILYVIGMFLASDYIDKKRRIVMCRGNHETQQLSQNGDDAIFKSRGEFFFKTRDTMDVSHYIDFFKSLPSAIILTDGEYNIWCSHGGFPIDPHHDEYFKNMPENSFYFVYDEHGYGANDIRWTDFMAGSADVEDNLSRASDRRETILKIIGSESERLASFLENANIDFIIRGHQDNYSNASILTNQPPNGIASMLPVGLNLDYWYNPNPSDSSDFGNFIKEENGIVRNDTNSADRTTDVSGPTYRIRADKNKLKLFFRPVMTISTNTDIKRSLMADGFIVLCLDSSFTNDFGSENNLLQTSHEINSEEDVNKYIESISSEFKTSSEPEKKSENHINNLV